MPTRTDSNLYLDLLKNSIGIQTLKIGIKNEKSISLQPYYAIACFYRFSIEDQFIFPETVHHDGLYFRHFLRIDINAFTVEFNLNLYVIISVTDVQYAFSPFISKI